MDHPLPAGSLDGIRVLDLSRILAGPTASQLMADLGADVIKVEKPGTGDDTRTWGPPFLPGENGDDSDISAYFICANRNKRSIAIDITSPEGVSLIRRLVAISDVVLENYKPATLTAAVSAMKLSGPSGLTLSGARSPALARQAPMPTAPATISSSRPWVAS
jgi:crotonobetainyl-CoA:carnitine CoA-transferase CaiB-like acyl-CoA transferase